MKNRLVTWRVRHANGTVIEMSLPKMARSRVKAIVEADARSTGTRVVFFTDRPLGPV